MTYIRNTRATNAPSNHDPHFEFDNFRKHIYHAYNMIQVHQSGA